MLGYATQSKGVGGWLPPKVPPPLCVLAVPLCGVHVKISFQFVCGRDVKSLHELVHVKIPLGFVVDVKISAAFFCLKIVVRVKILAALPCLLLCVVCYTY